MKFICEKCSMETKIGEGRINLVCQVCGCYDLKFDFTIAVSPVLLDNSVGPEIIVAKGDSFYGNHGAGSIWDLRDGSLLVRVPILEVTEKIEEKLGKEEMEEGINEKIGLSEEEKVEEDVEEKAGGEAKVKRPVLVRAKKRLRMKIG